MIMSFRNFPKIQTAQNITNFIEIKLNKFHKVISITTDNVITNFNQIVYNVMFMEKAFDRMWHQCLIFKLHMNRQAG